MALALEEARKGIGFTSPNPMVGAVIVRDNTLLATGYHSRDGAPHAEVEALSKLTGDQARGSTMYVTLEPCCHFGRTPPCTRAIIASGITRVVLASLDPDSRVSGKGVAELRAAGVVVETGLLEADGERLNSIYFHFRRTGTPYIVLKAALTLDGKIAAHTGHAKWISNEKSRNTAHLLRRRLRAIAVGRGTVEADAPRLDCRLPGWQEKPVDKLLFSRNRSIAALEPFLAPMRGTPGRIFLIEGEAAATAEGFIRFCREHQIDSVLVEGGGGLHRWFLENHLVHRVLLFYKPAFMGASGIPVVAGPGPDLASDLEEFTLNGVTVLENNFMVDLSKGAPLCLLDS
jgi:diaminohydroxyphosphoribosylaminopyrimidine deaminase/5-amino-6-(5-phosphoribosylamino)uracil reductase